MKACTAPAHDGRHHIHPEVSGARPQKVHSRTLFYSKRKKLVFMAGGNPHVIDHQRAIMSSSSRPAIVSPKLRLTL